MNHKISIFKFRFLRTLKKTSVYLNIFFLCNCSNIDNRKIPEKNKENIEAFLSEFLIENSAAYTLFGDKPMTEMGFFTGNQEDIRLDFLSEEDLKCIEWIDNSASLKNWQQWKEYIQSMKIKNFCFVEIVLSEDPLSTYYFLINFKAVEKIIKDNLNEFENKFGLNAKNFKEELKNPQSNFWKNCFSDQYLMGLLYGYGKHNALYFLERTKQSKLPEHFEIMQGPYDIDHFPLPTYGSLPDDTYKNKYIKQRQMIQKEVKKNGILKSVLKKLT
jgi:DNA-binding ferritin-like protein (Dps family)